MQSGNIAHQVIETVSGNLSGAVQINAVETLHDLGMVRDLEIRNYRLTESLDLHVLAVILSDGYAGIDDVRDGHHDLQDLLIQLFFLLGQLLQLLGIRS